jgi:cytochrome oxidase Cu insertion factor (SCO1/SenC/PrrC family)
MNPQTDPLADNVTDKAADPNRNRNRNRWMLVAIFAIFFGGFALAGLLRFSGWRPAGMKNHGELLQPPADLRRLEARLADGSGYPWDPAQRRWRILVAPPADCGRPCVTLAAELDLVWQLFGRHAADVHLLWVGVPPAGIKRGPEFRELRDDAALRAGLPRLADPKGVPVYVVDPNGFVVLRYAPGFDPSHLRQDMSRLLKLK